MCSKINLLVYEWPLIKWKIWYINGSIFPNLSQYWLKFKKIFKRLGELAQIWPKIGPIGIRLGHFFLKNWYMYGSTFKFPAARPFQNQTWVPPPGRRHQSVLVVLSGLFLVTLIINNQSTNHYWKVYLLKMIHDGRQKIIKTYQGWITNWRTRFQEKINHWSAYHVNTNN